jgi:hypothetical protein
MVRKSWETKTGWTVEYHLQTIEELDVHMGNFQSYMKSVQTDDVVHIMATVDFITWQALRLAPAAVLFKSSKKTKGQAVEH